MFRHGLWLAWQPSKRGGGLICGRLLSFVSRHEARVLGPLFSKLTLTKGDSSAFVKFGADGTSDYRRQPFIGFAIEYAFEFLIVFRVR